MKEEVAANSVSGGGVNMNPTGKVSAFKVTADVFRRIGNGRVKRSHWKKYIGEGEGVSDIRKHFEKKGYSIVQCEETGAYKIIRNMG